MKFRHAFRLFLMSCNINLKLTSDSQAYYMYLAKVHGRTLHKTRRGCYIK